MIFIFFFIPFVALVQNYQVVVTRCGNSGSRAHSTK